LNIVLAGFYGLPGVLRARLGHPGDLKDHVQRGVDELAGVAGNDGLPECRAIRDGCRRGPEDQCVRGPARAEACLLGLSRVQICNPHQVQAWR
jgi:hypothetical protein